MTVPQYSPILQTDLGNVYGALYMGMIFSSILYGVTCIQTFIYFQSQSKDRSAIKLLVLVLLVLDSVHQAFTVFYGYYVFILNFGDASASRKSDWSTICSVFLSSLTAFVIQWFYVLRLYKLSGRKKFIVLIIGAVMLAEFASNIAFFAQNLIALGPTRSRTQNTKSFASVSQLLFASTVVVDVLITSGLCFCLYRSKTGFQSTESVINKLIVYTVSTGVVTSIDALLLLITLIVTPGDFYFIFFTFLLPKLYCNSLLATLNIRSVLRDDLQEPAQSLSTFMVRGTGVGTSRSRRSEQPTTHTVSVDIQAGRDHSSQKDALTESVGDSEKINPSNATLFHHDVERQI